MFEEKREAVLAIEAAVLPLMPESARPGEKSPDRRSLHELNAEHLAASPNDLAGAPLLGILKKSKLKSAGYFRRCPSDNLRTVWRDI
jgi:hypothetical protein